MWTWWGYVTGVASVLILQQELGYLPFDQLGEMTCLICGKREMQIREKNIYSNMFNYKQNLSSNIIGIFETEKKCEHCTVSSANNCKNFKTN